jgi:hypothetical protein
MDGHSRWEIFELIGAVSAPPEPPHVEDLWVRSLRCLKKMAEPDLRRFILTRTMAPVGEAVFGVPLVTSHIGAYLLPGTGKRSLATVNVPAGRMRFESSWRVGAPEPDVRVWLPVPDLGERLLPVKDHHLLKKVEKAGVGPRERAKMLGSLIESMGEEIMVRLGLSRPFPGKDQHGPGFCWLMADGFFSVSDPQI